MTDRLCSECGRFYTMCFCDQKKECLANIPMEYDGEKVFCFCRECSAKIISEL